MPIKFSSLLLNQTPEEGSHLLGYRPILLSYFDDDMPGRLRVDCDGELLDLQADAFQPLNTAFKTADAEKIKQLVSDKTVLRAFKEAIDKLKPSNNLKEAALKLWNTLLERLEESLVQFSTYTAWQKEGNKQSEFIRRFMGLISTAPADEKLKVAELEAANKSN